MSVVGSFIGRVAALTGVHIDDGSTFDGGGGGEHVEPMLVGSSVRSGLAGRWWNLGLPGLILGKLGIHDRLELERLLFWIAAMVGFLLFAAVTNPSESSFRSHLTESSFRRHLAGIRSTDDSTTLEDQPSSPTPDSNVGGGNSGAETPPIAPFRFANHVAISLRTPPLYYKTLLFLAFALSCPLNPQTFLSDPSLSGKKTTTTANVPPQRVVLYIGYFGHWACVGHVPRKVEWVWKLATDGSREKGRKKNIGLDTPGVLEMRAVPPKDDALAFSFPARIGVTVPTGGGSLRHHIRKSESITNLADSASLPSHAHPPSIPVAPFVSESRRSSIVNLVSPQPLVNTVVDLPETSSPLIIALKVDLTSAQSVLAELKAQLHSHEESVSSAHSHLQHTLDELRTRRKEDDAERQELKTRTKSLEEQKRQAEAAKRDAEKKLRAIETIRDGLKAKMTAAHGQVENMRGMKETSGKVVQGIQEERARYVVATRETIQGEKVELEGLENELGELDAKNEELGRILKEAEEKLGVVVKTGEEARRMGPEEEMMMMAAAYEAAAQEGYQHVNPGTTGGHGYGRESGGGATTTTTTTTDQWAHQAAAYMAEAGMPYLDHNYTARPSHATSFAHLAKPTRDSTEDGKRNAGPAGDITGFEDFGPGARRGFPRMGTTTPPASDSGSDVWGHDPGSPNGGISSSFSENLLPQGLFRSLEGDQTLLDAGREAGEENDDGEEFHVRTTIQEALRSGPQGSVHSPKTNGTTIEHEMSSDSSEEPATTGRNEVDKSTPSEQHDAWRSPSLSTGLPTHHSNSSQRLLPPSSTPPPAAPAIPGLPALPGSRRWYSGTSSAENLHLGLNTFGSSPSNDTLNMIAGYDSSPFAPSAVEKQQLALNWGPLSKYRWARPNADPNAVTRTMSADLGPTSSSSAASGLHSTSTSPLSSTTWLTSRFPHGKRDSSPVTSSREKAGGGFGDSPTGSGGGAGTGVGVPGGDEDDKTNTADKKPFRFFSLRRPTSSGQGSDRSGTSPARGD